ncbi:MAG: helix-turn-helix domain-containing protein [Candidatus Omnitrophica bacterium]|nr:helix-turn-helix domain-containing protein [Candidatus Omnitrophota bacterium]
MTGVGEQLKRARTELQLTIKDVTQATKIQPWVLEALEQDRLHTSMSPIYVKSFLSTYAKFLRLDPTPFVAQLFPPPSPTVQAELQAVKAVKPPKPARAPKPKPVARTARPIVVLPDFSRLLAGVLSGLISIIARLLPLVRRLAIVAVGAGAIAGLVAINPLRKLSTIRRKEASVVAAPKRVITPAKMPPLNIPPTVPLELTLLATRPTWVSVKSDGQLIAQQRLETGSKEIWRARQRFELIIAEPAQVDVSLNGQGITPLMLANRGRVLITHAAIKPLAAAPTAQEARKEPGDSIVKPVQPTPTAAATPPAAPATQIASTPAAVATTPAASAAQPQPATSTSAKPTAASATAAPTRPAMTKTTKTTKPTTKRKPATTQTGQTTSR